jgi:hypothetical protein
VFASFARFGIHDRDAGGARAAAAATPPVRRFQTFAATPDSVGKGPATLGAVQMDGFRWVWGWAHPACEMCPRRGRALRAIC